jgi:hypothetical protein
MLTTRICWVLLAVAALAGCSNQQQGAAPPAASGDRIAKLHAAAECLRQHGISNFADPVLGASGQVFTDLRGLESADVTEGTVEAALNACRDQLGAASWNPNELPPAPAALVAAGVRGAQCMREHGLPNFQDPTANSPYTPGHGFGMRPEDLPPGADKGTPSVQSALTACRSILDAEIAASRLDQLAGK